MSAAPLAIVTTPKSQSRDSTSPRLVVENLTKRFNGRPAIVDVSLSVVEHEFAAVLGPSGAGKTTLFRCIAGLVEPDRGTLRLDAGDIARSIGRSRRRVAIRFLQMHFGSLRTTPPNALAPHLPCASSFRGRPRPRGRADPLLSLGS